MDFKLAITRVPPSNAADGLTSLERVEIDFDLLLEQHRAYVAALNECGLEVLELSADESFPDSYFIEDTAVVTEEFAVIARPGAQARLGEEFQVEQVLKRFREKHSIHAPGTLEGGDVLQIGKRFFVGLSDRTNQSGAEQFQEIVGKFGYEVDVVDVEDTLHLKSDVSWLGGDQILVTHRLAAQPCFSEFTQIVLDAPDFYAANAVLINGKVFFSDEHPKAADLLIQRGLRLVQLSTSEFRKMDGGLSCLSIRM